MPNDVEGLRDGADTAAAAVTGTGSAAGVAQETSDRAEAATVEPIEARDAEHFGNLVREMNSGTTPMAPIFAQGINLQNIDLRGLVIPPGSDFYGAELDKADFTNATLAGVILDGASLQYACFLGTIFCKDGNDGPTNLASIYGADFK